MSAPLLRGARARPLSVILESARHHCRHLGVAVVPFLVSNAAKQILTEPGPLLLFLALQHGKWHQRRTAYEAARFIRERSPVRNQPRS